MHPSHFQHNPSEAFKTLQKSLTVLYAGTGCFLPLGHKHTKSHILTLFAALSASISTHITHCKQGGQAQHQINSQISTGHDVSTIEVMLVQTPTELERGTASQHQPFYSRFSHFHRYKAKETLGYNSFSNILLEEMFYLHKSNSQQRQYRSPGISAISWKATTYLENQRQI